MERTITINDSSAFKVLGIIIAVVIQTVGVYNALLAKFEEVKTESRAEVSALQERIVQLQFTMKERERYIEFAENVKNELPAIQREIIDMSQQDTEFFRKLNNLERRLQMLEQGKKPAQQ